MNENKIKRREAIKAIGIAGGFGTVSSVGGATSDAIGSTRLIEVGLEYELNEDHNYRTFGADTARLYRIDSDSGITITRHADKSIESLFGSTDVIVSGDYMAAPPVATNETEPTKGLPTFLASRYRTAEWIKLAESFYPPEVTVSQNRNRIELAVEDLTAEISPGPEQTYTLSPQRVTAETISVLDERVDDSSIPKSQRALKTEEGEVSINATPKVKVRDFGEMEVTKER